MLANKKLMTNYSIKNTEAAIIFEDRNDTGEDIQYRLNFGGCEY